MRLRHGVFLLIGALAWPGLATGQVAETGPVPPQEEARILREASSHEWRGRLDEAETVLMRLLERNPTSSGGLFALERVLRTRSRVGRVLPFVDRFIAGAPDASGPRYMKLRVLVEIDSLDALEPAARAWFAAEPDSPDPYREVGRIYQRVYGDARALDVLRSGRDALGDPDALALEIGDALSRSGEAEAAVAEWARALRDPRGDVEGVLRRLQGLGGDRADLARPVFQVLTGEGASEERRRAAVRTAIALGAPDLARSVAEDGLAGLDRAHAPAYLQDVARRADDAGMADLSLWALSTLQRRVPAATGDAGVEARMAAAALAAGDTVAAMAAQVRLVRSLPRESTERRRALVDLIRVESAVGSVDGATVRQRLEGFLGEFPDAPERDDVTARTAAGLARRGDVAGALALVEGATGPESRLERAWILLDSGELALGQEALEAALPGLAPTAATEVIQLITVLERVGPAAAAALAESAARARHGDAGEARRILEDTVDAVGESDRAALLFQAGRLALDAGDSAGAGDHFARIEGAHFDSPEAPEAMLRHARILATDPARADEARSLLERLILERPRAAVVPDARRELERLGRGS